LRGKKSLLAVSGVIGAHPGTAPAQSRIWQPRKLSKPVGATISGKFMNQANEAKMPPLPFRGEEGKSASAPVAGTKPTMQDMDGVRLAIED